jgi:tetratricopeptide (TPR) repeat protein
MRAGQPPEVKETPVLRPPGQPSDSGDGAGADYRWLWMTLLALLILALAVIFGLPRVVVPVAQTEMPAPAPVSTGDSEAQRAAANQALQRYLQLRAGLALDNADAWGEPDWSEAAGLASAADRYFAERRFALAARDYQAALDRLQQLDAGRADMLTEALDAGVRALAENDVDTAIARFEAALRIAPDHPDAERGLVQARNRGASLEHMNRGTRAEAEKNLEAARDAYRQAVQLDADHAAAQAALQRVAGQIDARDFAEAMTRALGALDRGQTNEADTALAEAERLQPGDTAVRDARQRLQEMRTRAALSSLRRQASDRAGREDWQAVIALYRRALKVDPAAGFAREGLRHAEARAQLHAQFDHYLDQPARLYSAVPLANAKQLLAAANEAPRDEPRLAEKIAALRELVSSAATPMTLTLRSDGATDVVVYRVGRLGQFETHALQLLPGDYTVVGSRPGYRDVRKVIAVRPGVPLPPVVVRCEEVI